MRAKILLFIGLLLIACDKEDLDIYNSDRIVELISNSPASINNSHDFSNFSSIIEYQNDEIKYLNIFNNNKIYNFTVTDSLVSECIVTEGSMVLVYKFLYEYDKYGSESNKFSSIKVYEKNQLLKEFVIGFDGRREIINNINNPNEFYTIIYDFDNRIGAISGTNNLNLNYAYSAGNLTSIRVGFGDKYVYFKYDEKINPFKSERVRNIGDVINYIYIIDGNENSLLMNSYNIFSNENNITRIDVSNYTGEEFEEVVYDYEYNDYNLPISKLINKYSLIIEYKYD